VLVAAGTDVELPSARDGVTPVQHAENLGHAEIAQLLRAAARTPSVDRGDPDRRRQAGQRLLATAATREPDKVALALRSGARLEVRDGRRRSPLLLAAAADRVEAARVLVALGADPDALDARHDTPWLLTGVTGSVPMGRLLLTAHPDLDIRNRFGGVSVVPASERGHVGYVRWVVAHTGIDVNHVNDLGWTALLEAVILGDGTQPYQQIVRILLGAGADVDIADGDGVTALQHARTLGQIAIVRLLRRAA
jgi:ankyrin repeat protein